MTFAKKYISLLSSIALLWMTLLPTLSVCGMFKMYNDIETTPLVSCCPTEVLKLVEIPSEKECHPTNDAASHSCMFCPCEFSASMLTAKVASINAPESFDLPAVLFTLLLDEVSSASDSSFPLLYSQQSHLDSGPPSFIRNCSWLI